MDHTHGSLGTGRRLTRLASLAAAALIATSCAAVTPSASPSQAPSLTATPSSTATPSPSIVPTPTIGPSFTPPPTAEPQPTPQVPPADDETLAAVYAALRPENLRSATGPRVFARGQAVLLRFEMVNRSSSPLVVPLTSSFERPASWYGVIQTWIEPVDAGVSLDACFPTAGRKGAWYATGGWSGAFGGAATAPIRPGDGTTVSYGLSAFQTACFPAGRYRYHLEYKRFDAGVDDVIAGLALNIELRAARGWTLGLPSPEGTGARATLRLSSRSTHVTSDVTLTGLAPGTRLSVGVRAGGCDRDGAVIVPARMLVAAADGTITDRTRTRLSAAARRAITVGELPGLRLGEACMAYVALPIAFAANRAPTTWGGGLLREATPGGIVLTASSESSYGQLANAADGVVDNMWNSGGYPPAWIELDLGRNTRLTGIRLLPSQLPNVADTLHRVYGRKDGSRTEVLLAELKGTTRDNTWIDVAFEQRQHIRYVRVATLASPSWVAWREILVQGPDNAPPSVMPQGTHDGSLDRDARGDRCYANGGASDPDDRSRRVQIRVLVDGTQVWSGPASESRPDVAAAGFGDGRQGFWVRLDRMLELGVGHEVRVQALDAETGRWVDLNQTPRTLTCR